MAELEKYEGVAVLRVDDPTGERDVPLKERTDKANEWGADIYISVHHNANTGKWGTWTGTETYYAQGSAKGLALAKAIHPRYVKAFGLKDRGIKTNNLHITRETHMPAILTEGGYMDSSVDIKHLRSHTRLVAQGTAIAEGAAAYLGAKRKADTESKGEDSALGSSVGNKVDDKNASADKSFLRSQAFVKAKGISDGTYPHRAVTRQEVWAMMERLYNLK